MKTFWIVTYPTVDSELVDICFETDWIGLDMQFKGGLTGAEVVGSYQSEAEARTVAQSLLDARTVLQG